MATRKPMVAGSFYSENKKDLEGEVKKYLGKGKKQDIKGCVVPHAGYMFSGLLAGKVISKIKQKKNFIIIGVNHSGLGNKISFSLEDFEMPFGVVKNNKILAKEILENLKKEVDADMNEEAHNNEHSIEVELPFLQLSQKKFKIIPILPKNLSYEECKSIAKILSDFMNKDTCLIVSSDFTHYGFSYGFVPFTSNVKENLEKLDKDIIDSILKLNSKEVYEKARKSTVCGIFGLAILTEIASIKKWKGKLVEYYTSGDVTGDFRNAVGYAGIIFV